MILDNEEEIQGVKFSEFPSEPPASADEVVGLHSGGNARFSVANIVLLVRQGLANIFVPNTRKVNNKALSSDITLTASDVGAYELPAGGIPATDLASGVVPSISTSTPQMDSTGAAGSTGEVSDAGHVHPSDTSKANQAQLAVENNNETADRAYSIGQYLVHGGKLFRAAAAIASGDTLTSGSNIYEVAVSDAMPIRFSLGSASPKTLTFSANARALLVILSSSSSGMGIYGLESTSAGVPAAVAMVAATGVSMSVSGSALNLTTSVGCVCALTIYAGSVAVSATE